MKHLFSFIFVFFCAFIFAQKTVSGVVRDDDGPVASASVTVEEPGKDAIIAYGITNAKGEYKVSFTSSAENVDLKIKAFNHKTMVKSVKNDSHTENFNIASEATEIKEVKIKTKLITKRGDTISYDIKAFESKSDRTVADVLKKIPGIEVNTDGTVLYQGEAINKFYVNGKDLMEGGYGTINNSLPKDAVQKVEVLENHQPVKILQDKVPSESAALNIVTKNKVTMTGRGEVGAGFSPFLWNLKLTPMFFGQKSQWVVNYKTNNNGETVENEGNMLAFGNRWEGRRVQAGQSDWLNLESAGTPSLPEKRYLLNNVHYASANILTNPFKNKEWELKANASYTNNAVKRASYQQTRDLEADQTYFTDISNKFYTDKIKGELIFTKNAKKGFFKNTTTFSQFWNADRAITNRRDQLFGERNSVQDVESPTTNFQNSLSTIIPWKEKMVNLMSYIHYQNDHQTLGITPASYLKVPIGFDSTVIYFNELGASRIVQDFTMKTFEAYHSANVSFIKKGWTFTPEVGLNYQSNVMTSDLSGITGSGQFSYSEAYMNSLKFRNTIPYASLGINYKSDAWMLYANAPLNFNHINIDDDLRGNSKDFNKTTFSPNFFAQYSFASFWKASTSGSLNYNFGDISDVYVGRILTNPNGFSSMEFSNPLAQTKSTSAGARIEYRNPLNNLFFNVSYRLGWSTRNLTPNVITPGTGFSYTIYEVQDMNTDTQTFSAEVGKYFPKFKTNASVGYSNRESKTIAVRNSTRFNSNNNSQSITFKLNNTYFQWMSLDYNMSYGWTRQKTNGVTNQPSKSYTHNFVTYFYPVDNHTVGFYWDQVNSGTSAQMYRNGFYDLSYQYTWAKKKIDFELKWLNIANRKVFERYSLTTFTEAFTRYELRPSQVMFTVKFNFK